MKKYIKQVACLLLLALPACKATIDGPSPSEGSADFSNYVAIGNSLTAGYADGGLYLEGQLNSYPSMIARQLQTIRPKPFIQPEFPASQFNGSGYLRLDSIDKKGNPFISPDTTNLAYTRPPSTLANGVTPKLVKYDGSINNFGVPGIQVSQIREPKLAGANPYFERILPDSLIGKKNYISIVYDSKPTFFTCWLGNNDVLSYAASGGADPRNLHPTQGELFSRNYIDFVDSLLKNGAKGVLATIPDITLTPFFTTKTVDAVRAAISPDKNKLLDLYIKPSKGLPRVATSGDLILLTADSIGKRNALNIPQGLSPLYPIPDKDVLDQDEVMEARTAIANFNATISKEVSDHPGQLGLLDINKVLAAVAGGNYIINGSKQSLAFITGGIFSLDGIHLTPRGYAVIANEYIKTINFTFGASVPTFSPASYRGTKYPR